MLFVIMQVMPLDEIPHMNIRTAPFSEVNREYSEDLKKHYHADTG